MKASYLVLLLSLLLQSCHQDKVSATEEQSVKEPKPAEAATYNTQLGLAYLKQGNRTLAKHKLLKALSQAPGSPSVNAAMAYFMEKTGELEKAEMYYQKAMAADRHSGAQFNNYGAFLCRRGQYIEAEKYFLKAVNDIKYENTAGAYENAGLCAMALPDYVKAEHYFEKALAQDPSRAQSLYELVKLEMSQGHANEALGYLQKYPTVSLRDKTLLQKGIEAAHQVGKIDLEEEYKLRLHSISDPTGDKNEYNNNNG